MPISNTLVIAFCSFLGACSSSLGVSAHSAQAPSPMPVANYSMSHDFRIPGGTLRLVGYPEANGQISIRLLRDAGTVRLFKCAEIGTSPNEASAVGSPALRNEEQPVAILTQLSALAVLANANSWIDICGQRFELAPNAKAELEAYLREFRMRALPMKEWPSRPQARSQAFGPIVASGL